MLVSGSVKNSWTCFQKASKNRQLAGGFNPIEKYSSKWVHLPQFSGWTLKNVWVATTQLWINLPWKSLSPNLPTSLQYPGHDGFSQVGKICVSAKAWVMTGPMKSGKSLRRFALHVIRFHALHSHRMKFRKLPLFFEGLGTGRYHSFITQDWQYIYIYTGI